MGWFSRYSLKYTYYLIYMLQASEYRGRDFLSWWWRTSDFSKVMHRKKPDATAKARVLWVCWSVFAGLAAVGIVGMFIYAAQASSVVALAVGLAAIVVYPLVVALGILPLVWLGYVLVQRPRERAIIDRAMQRLQSMDATRIAVAGSYGKTSMKEMLRTILSEKYTVAATPGNKNTPLGTSGFIQSLSGDEDMVIFEYGEARVGDVQELCDITRPQYGFITGISEAHLETFGSREAIVQTIFELDDYLDNQEVMYRNIDSPMVAEYVNETDIAHNYGVHGVGDWSVSDVQSSLEGVSFTVTHKKKAMQVSSQLIGRHQVGPLVACMAFAFERGLTYDQIVAGVSKTKAFEHRMQPRRVGGALVIDDTYNGNPLGMKSGLALLRTADAKRRIYVTPGLVEMGSESTVIHYQLGQDIATAADVVILMANSATEDIVRGMQDAGFEGELDICQDPLEFYPNIEHFVAKGDVVLMQNDWGDNYA